MCCCYHARASVLNTHLLTTHLQWTAENSNSLETSHRDSQATLFASFPLRPHLGPSNSSIKPCPAKDTLRTLLTTASERKGQKHRRKYLLSSQMLSPLEWCSLAYVLPGTHSADVAYRWLRPTALLSCPFFNYLCSIGIMVWIPWILAPPHTSCVTFWKSLCYFLL